MPREPFRHPGDAREQLARASALHERLFARRPDGVWPSEGSVSDAMVPLVAETGFRWMATDEEILARTLGKGFSRNADGHLDQPELLYKPYRIGQPARSIACGFRDHALSDMIGFRYASWSAGGAANDFVCRLEEAGRRYAARTSGGEATIFVILDGENAWEYYDGQGRPFLRALYGALASNPGIRTVTMSEACGTATETVPSIFPGSWINADFYIWIGHADDHRAWSQLAAARTALAAAGPSVAEASRARAYEEMLIAEGSDWFWWYGDDHSSDHDLTFDDLFRRHVRNVYRALEKPVPEELFLTNITTAPPRVEIESPTGFIRPVIDGEVTSYFEWIGAGCLEASAVAGSMHQVSEREPEIRIVEFGFDLEHLFLRIDTSAPAREILAAGLTVSVNFLRPAGVRAELAAAGGRVAVSLVERARDGDSQTRECPDIKAAAGSVVELELPFRCLGAGPHAAVGFVVALSRGGTEVARHPRHQPIEVEVPDQGFAARNWTA
jgi:hypothetical protein